MTQKRKPIKTPSALTALPPLSQADRLRWLCGLARTREAMELSGLSDDALRLRASRGVLEKVRQGDRAIAYRRWQLLGLRDPLAD